jgi:type II secretory pathway component PulF
MAYFEYVAKDISGKSIRGKQKAADEKQAWNELRSSGLFPLKVREVRNKKRKRPLKAAQLTIFSNAVSSMVLTGIPLAQAVKLLCHREKRADLKELYSRIYSMLLQGTELSEAMEAQEGIFPPLIIGMFRAGEAEGNLGEAAGKMAVYYERENKLRKKMGTAMTYPIFLMFVIAAALLLLFTQILPEFFHIFESMETLPASTHFLMIASNMLTNYYLEMILLLTALVAVIYWILDIPAVQNARDRLILYLPFAGTQVRAILTARFARTFRSLYTGGVPVLESLGIAGEVIGNEYMKSRFARAIEDVKNGTALSDAIAGIKELDYELAVGLYIGEEAGAIDSMMDQTADSFEEKAETAAERLLALAEPVMIIMLAALIGYIMLSVMVPVYRYYQAMG